MEITLFYREFVFYAPSVIALASLTLARYLCGRPRQFYEETDECLEVVELLHTRLSKHVNDLSETLIKKIFTPRFPLLLSSITSRVAVSFVSLSSPCP